MIKYNEENEKKKLSWCLKNQTEETEGNEDVSIFVPIQPFISMLHSAHQ